MADNRWRELEPRFQREWEARYKPTGLDWSEVWPAYHFGWIAGQRPEFRNRPFEEVKDDLARHWYWPEEPDEEAAWDYVQEAVEEGYRKGQEEVQENREGK